MRVSAWVSFLGVYGGGELLGGGLESDAKGNVDTLTAETHLAACVQRILIGAYAKIELIYTFNVYFADLAI